MKPKNFDVNEVISDLGGTCKTLAEALPEGMDWEDLTQKDHEKIDAEIFCCETCGWWHEIDEQAFDGENCKDCANED